MAFSNQDDDEVLSEMNVTPLVDVMLVLLVVFIVTAPLMTNAVHVNLPRTGAVAPPESSEPMVVSVDAEGHYFIGKQEYAFEQLETRLQQAHEENPQQAVQLQADEGVNYGQVAKAMAALERSGIQKVAVLTQQ
ncbi:outer membrane transport energization protein ExbD [Kushneria sinocarnis]|uniref:Outer membrane transport energization protein ExbD n=1 Tax=Kushneria sinocarnis TaxID=595502 RepID=A0A420WXU9_9GAMM|nr:biopolymer transporter ExbD [Kushneria sinocarnis]RKR04502.1 outer membrane transport energization protein ExbD [Kushneria sinocarnis]